MNFITAFMRPLFLTAALSLTATSALAQDATNKQNQHTEAVRIGTWDRIGTLDPLDAAILEHTVVLDALYSGLVSLDKEKGIVPQQASSWTVSPDGKRYEFKLRDDIFWTDGMPVIAQDFVVAYQRIVNPELKIMGKPSWLMTGVKNANAIIKGKQKLTSLGVTAIDDKTLVIELEAPASYFLDILDHPGMAPAPAHMLEKYGDDWWQQTPLVSNGDYRLVSFNKDRVISLELKDKNRHPEAPELVEIIPLLNLPEAVAEMIRGKLDIVWDLRKGHTDWMESQANMHSFVTPLPMTTYTYFNTNSPKFSDKRVRQALSLVIDRQKIAHSENVEPARTLSAASMMSDFMDELGAPHQGISYDQRVRQARELMKQVGYGPQNPLNISISVLDRKRNKVVADGLRAMFSQIWVNTKLRSMSDVDISKHTRSDDLQVNIEYWIADYNDAMAFYSLYRSDGTRNFARFANQEYDELIDKALLEQDVTKRQEIYAKLETILRDEAPVIPLSHGNFLTVVSPRIKDSGMDAMYLCRIVNLRLNPPRTPGG